MFRAIPANGSAEPRYNNTEVIPGDENYTNLGLGLGFGLGIPILLCLCVIIRLCYVRGMFNTRNGKNPVEESNEKRFDFVWPWKKNIMQNKEGRRPLDSGWPLIGQPQQKNWV